jgi:hypothetical protein
LTVSIRVCTTRNSGRIRQISSPIEMTSTGTATMISQDSATSSRSAITTPPTMVMGAATNTVDDSSASSWTCCTSFVVLVISDGAPKWLSSRAENDSTRSNTAPRTSRPKPIAARAPR